MTITTQDIQLYQPEVLDDTDNGGGRMSPNQVVDGELNNLFDDQSRFDRVTGRVSLRKGWLAVISQNRDKLLGSHAILLQKALDPNVHISMYGRDDHTDRRDDAQQHLEQYLAAGATTPHYCYDTQPQGALIVSLLTELSNTPPAAGDVVVFSVERGTVNLGMQQFARCVKVESTEVSATVPPNFAVKTLQLIDITIDQPLRFDLPGESFGFNQPASQKTLIRRTTLAGGKRYYSIHPITAAITQGATSCTVAAIKTPMVPAATQEVGIVDKQIGADALTLIPLTPPDNLANHTETVRGVSIANSAAVILPEHALIPGTVTVKLMSTLYGDPTQYQHVLKDDGRGQLVRDASSGGSVPSGVTGTVDYVFGQIVVTGMLDNTGVLNPSYSNVNYRAAVAVSDVQHTAGEEITLLNRGLVYTRTLTPVPQPTTLQVEYRALGRWITLRDRGDGTLAGASGEGTGTINYATGSINLTLGNEPDVGSHLLFGWGGRNHLPSSAASTAMKFQLGTVKHTLAAGGQGVSPGSVSITYSDGVATRTITDDGQGNLTGDGRGFVNYAAATLEFEPTYLPAAGASAFSVAYNKRVIVTESPAGTVSGSDKVFQLTGDPIAGSVTVRATYQKAGDPAQWNMNIRELSNATLVCAGPAERAP